MILAAPACSTAAARSWGPAGQPGDRDSQQRPGADGRQLVGSARRQGRHHHRRRRVQPADLTLPSSSCGHLDRSHTHTKNSRADGVRPWRVMRATAFPASTTEPNAPTTVRGVPTNAGRNRRVTSVMTPRVPRTRPSARRCHIRQRPSTFDGQAARRCHIRQGRRQRRGSCPLARVAVVTTVKGGAPRAGIIGTGFIGGVHAHSVHAAGYQLSRVAASSPARARAAADRLACDASRRRPST